MVETVTSVMYGRPPSCKDLLDGVEVACGHVSGRCVRSVTAGLDGIRGSAPIQADGLKARDGRRVSPIPVRPVTPSASPLQAAAAHASCPIVTERPKAT